MAHILIVEDYPPNRVVMSKSLTKIGGYQVTVTEDVAQVLELTRTGQIAFVVMDVSLKNSFYQGQSVDGVAITQMLKADPAARDIPVLLATAHAMNGVGERLLAQSGADGYISKPFTPKELVSQVQQILAVGG